MRPEYDFTGGVRGKYARELRKNGYTIRVYNADGTFTETRVLGEKTVVLEPDVSDHWKNYHSCPDVDGHGRRRDASAASST